MSKIYIKKKRPKFSLSKKIIVRTIGSLLVGIGIFLIAYIFTPLILWEIFLAPVFASNNLAIPIPKTILVTPGTIKSLLSSEAYALMGVDYSDANNWFPSYTRKGTTPTVSSYTISIPALSIDNAVVSTVDTDLSHHLVQLGGTALPSNKGNTVIFGHSTLPQLYDPKNYKTIFANLHTIKIGDIITVKINSIIYTYKIFSLTVIDPDDTSVLGQDIDDSYLTIITCTPPGTIWKRLVVKARIQTI